eukprot:bmy_09541T0
MAMGTPVSLRAESESAKEGAERNRRKTHFRELNSDYGKVSPSLPFAHADPYPTRTQEPCPAPRRGLQKPCPACGQLNISLDYTVLIGAGSSPEKNASCLASQGADAVTVKLANDLKLENYGLSKNSSLLVEASRTLLIVQAQDTTWSPRPGIDGCPPLILLYLLNILKSWKTAKLKGRRADPGIGVEGMLFSKTYKFECLCSSGISRPLLEINRHVSITKLKHWTECWAIICKARSLKVAAKGISVSLQERHKPKGTTAPFRCAHKSETHNFNLLLNTGHRVSAATAFVSPVPKRAPGPHASVPLPRGGGAGGPGRGGGEGRAGAGEPGAARNRAPRAPGGRARAPSSSGRTGRRGGRAALTRCCCRLLTATAAADAALCRSSAACPGRSRLRVNLRVRSLAIARRGPGARVPPPSPAPISSTHRRSGSGTRSLSPPSPFLALLARGGFFSLTPPTPCAPPKLRDDFPNSALLRARAANSAGGPGPAAAPLERGPRDARGAAPARANPRAQPATRGCARRPGDRRVAGEGRGAAAAAGLRAGPAHRPRAHLEAPCGAGALAAFAGFARTFRGWRVGAGRAQFALPALESDQRLINGLLQGVTQGTGVRGFDEQMPICPTLTLYDVHSMGHTEKEVLAKSNTDSSHGGHEFIAAGFGPCNGRSVRPAALALNLDWGGEASSPVTFRRLSLLCDTVETTGKDCLSSSLLDSMTDVF